RRLVADPGPREFPSRITFRTRALGRKRLDATCRGRRRRTLERDGRLSGFRHIGSAGARRVYANAVHRQTRVAQTCELRPLRVAAVSSLQLVATLDRDFFVGALLDQRCGARELVARSLE